MNRRVLFYTRQRALFIFYSSFFPLSEERGKGLFNIPIIFILSRQERRETRNSAGSFCLVQYLVPSCSGNWKKRRKSSSTKAEKEQVFSPFSKLSSFSSFLHGFPFFFFTPPSPARTRSAGTGPSRSRAPGSGTRRGWSPRKGWGRTWRCSRGGRRPSRASASRGPSVSSFFSRFVFVLVRFFVFFVCVDGTRKR